MGGIFAWAAVPAGARGHNAPVPHGTDINTPLALLGGLSPAAFMRRHWHRRPLLVRAAWPQVQPPLDRAGLFALAARGGVESRLVVHRPGKGGRPGSWELQRGPLSRRRLPPLRQSGWTLLVQGVDLHVPAAHEMLARFRFVPQARLDDLMVSWASDGGGVGPHYDSYDVFLLQVQGRRRWRIGPLAQGRRSGMPATLRTGVPLKLLAHFTPQEEHVLEPGDMLYLPPRWAHDGDALGECMTCSIGFRAPSQGELVRELLGRLADEPEDGPGAGDDADAAGPAAQDPARLYRDPQQPATRQPGAVPAALQQFARDALTRTLARPGALERVLGEYLSEPKADVWFEPGRALPRGAGVRLAARTRMLYDVRHVYVNGESWRAAGADARLLRRLADHGRLPAAALQSAGAALRETLAQWAVQGWLEADDDADTTAHGT